ncbi:MAG: GAF domain-containing sensor histidine kinase [Anaerolineae bacterium]|nr:GAF domain-containing sensor histidine kinase [Anaerolineae bacterium]
MGGDGCFITLWDAESRRVLPGAAYGELRDVYAHVSPEPGERTLTEAALNAGRPIAVEDILSRLHLSADVVPLYPMHSVLALPLRADGRNLGAVLIGFNERHHFSPTEVAWAEQAADLIALAIAKAQAYSGLEQRVERLELLNQITRVSTTAQNVTDLVESLVNFAARIIGGDSCYISLWDADNQRIVPGAAYGPLRESFRHTPSRPGEPSLTEEVLASGQPLAVSDPDEAPHLRDRIAQVFGARSMLALPLLADGRKLGALIIGFHQPHVFPDAEVTWAEQAADLIALAIAKAQAYAELEQRVEQRTAELRAANERLQALSNIKDEFVSNVSHELRTPIASLKLYHDLLARNPTHQNRYVTRLERETDRLERIIEDLLYLSRMEQGQVELAPEPVALNALAEQYALDRAPLAENHKLHLALETQDGLPPVLADSRLLEQALSTLLTNALSYTPPGGTVTILTRSAERNGGQWVGIGIKDTGPGIPEAERLRLFERFFRGQAAVESGTPGTGLGLSIAHEIVERHGGEMEVQSDGGPGAGATFLIWLPALDGR